MLRRNQKEEIVKNLSEEIKNSKSVVFSDYRGLKASEINALKKELKKEGTNLMVIKKSLIDLSLKKAKIDSSVKGMEGQMAITISSEDEVVPAKILSKFSKTNENLKILGGMLGKDIMTVEEVMALAKLPGKEELLAKIVGSLNAPISGFVNVLSGNTRGLVNVLKAIQEKKA
ncbi:MAG: 50S ribosomal protein L10 [Candidatus Moranbacteria bacterium]|jgi:large subunit ribosomal protein L10|nr:50S ribosomal protein L10 [Candidatus Moranbacteria bacterium]MDD5652398.1 50S ribosomal protein L10 [Candidatus Moranbacteria bacterium]MDX9855738.1 50S ribosomal protein L10 [Candidatus Moranbacteria bacterium]